MLDNSTLALGLVGIFGLLIFSRRRKRTSVKPLAYYSEKQTCITPTSCLANEILKELETGNWWFTDEDHSERHYKDYHREHHKIYQKGGCKFSLRQIDTRGNTDVKLEQVPEYEFTEQETEYLLEALEKIREKYYDRKRAEKDAETKAKIEALFPQCKNKI